MQNLRIVGVQAEGSSPELLLSDDAGAEYALPIDEALKSAAARPSSASGQRAAGEKTSFSPREIQARLRTGATVAEVIEDSGLSEAHVLRYAGPVADERAFYASRARATVVARPSTAENHRLAFGDAPATLEDMVKVRLRAIGVRLRTLTWDAWRRDDGLWAVVADFDAASSEVHAEPIGQQPPAEWVYDPSSRAVRAVNKWAESLITLPAASSSPRSGRRLAAVEEPFDVDQRTPVGRSSSPSADAGASGGQDDGTDQEDLLDILRARRGQRLGSDESGDEKLATLLTKDESAAESAPTPLRVVEDSPERPDSQQSDPLQPAENVAAGESSTSTDAWGFSYEDPAEDDADSAADDPTPADDSAPADDTAPSYDTEPEEEQKPAAQAPRKKKSSSSRRPAMPRWDDILFGTKED